MKLGRRRMRVNVLTVLSGATALSSLARAQIVMELAVAVESCEGDSLFEAEENPRYPAELAMVAGAWIVKSLPKKI